MTREGHDRRACAELSSSHDVVGEDLLMSLVDAVEDADRDHRAVRRWRRELALRARDNHGLWSPSSGGALLSLASLLIARDEILQDGLVANLVRRGHPVDQEDALQVVVLVLDDAAGKPGELLLVFGAID